ncbi:hypothetical protein BN2537_12003 [Streptomyces venezuelae]|nr:hypothetical protein BN2537_12003 [Streptomyces venezuelae]
MDVTSQLAIRCPVFLPSITAVGAVRPTAVPTTRPAPAAVGTHLGGATRRAALAAVCT